MMEQETIKNLHKVVNPEVRKMLEEKFPEAFETRFDVEKYLKELIKSANQVNIDADCIDFRKDGCWILDFRKKDKKYWLKHGYFKKIQREAELNELETKKLCTAVLNSLTGWEGVTTCVKGYTSTTC